METLIRLMGARAYATWSAGTLAAGRGQGAARQRAGTESSRGMRIVTTETRQATTAAAARVLSRGATRARTLHADSQPAPKCVAME